MKFVSQDGTILPVYQQLTELVDEQMVAGGNYENLSAAQAIAVSQQLIDASQAGDYAALMTQFHVDYYQNGKAQPWAEGTLDYAHNLGIPIWNADQWLNFTATRHDAQFQNISWSAATGQLTFNIAATANTNRLSILLPLTYGSVNFNSVLVDGNPASYTTFSVSGQELALVSVQAGNHTFAVGYGAQPNTPTLTPIMPTNTPTNTPLPTNTPTNTPTVTPTPQPGVAPGVVINGSIAGGNLSVNVSGKFQLDFTAANGWQPTSWYDLATSTSQDLANKSSGGLGHNVLVSPFEVLYNTGWYSLDNAQNATVSILEQSPARAILQTQYHLATEGGDFLVQAVYTIYASGRIAVNMAIQNATGASQTLTTIEYPSVNVESTLGWSTSNLSSNHAFAFQRLDGAIPLPNLLVINQAGDTNLSSDGTGNQYWTVANQTLSSKQFICASMGTSVKSWRAICK